MANENFDPQNPDTIPEVMKRLKVITVVGTRPEIIS